MTVRAFRLAAPVLCGAALAGLAMTGCSAHVTVGTAQLSTSTLNQGVSDALTKQVGHRPDSVNCPQPLDAQAGKSERCTLTASGTTYGLTVTVVSYSNGTAHYDVQVDNTPQN